MTSPLCFHFFPTVLLNYLITYWMVQSPSWEANWFAASQEIPHILWNPKVHYRTHKCLPPVPILGQPNLVHIPTSHLLEIHPNIHPSMPRSPQWSLSLRFPHQDPIHPPLLTRTRHMPSPSHSSRFMWCFYWPYLKNVLEMFYFCSQTHIASKKHAMHCMLKFSFLNWRHYILNAFFQVIFNARLTSVQCIHLIHHKYNLHRFRYGEWRGQNPLPVILSPRTLSQQCICIVCIMSCCTVLLKQGIGSPVTGQVFIVTADAS